MVLLDFGKGYFIVLLNGSTLKASFILDYEEYLNTMEQRDL